MNSNGVIISNLTILEISEVNLLHIGIAELPGFLVFTDFLVKSFYRYIEFFLILKMDL